MIELTVGGGGGATYVNPPASVAVCISGFVTTTSTAPAACTPLVAVIVAGLTTRRLVTGIPPIVTDAPVTKFEPPIDTFVPPLVEPALGIIEETVTGGISAKFSVSVPAAGTDPDADRDPNPVALAV